MQTLASTAAPRRAPGASAGGGIGSKLRSRVHYSRRFYGRIEQEDVPGRIAVVERVLGLVPVRSVVDLGCGTGQWLAAFVASGVEDVLGVDGPWVPPEMLAVAPERFSSRNLAGPIDLGRRFDLAVSLEVAEHLPAGTADRFVDLLVSAAPVVLFSAAVPGQGGSGHVNEQWPEYWAARFARRGYVVLDAIRPAIWNDERIPPYMRQNLFLYARPDVVAAHPTLAAARAATDGDRLSLVHPGEFAKVTDPREMSLRRVVGALPGALAAACRRRVRP